MDKDVSLSVERRVSITVFAAMDQLVKASHQSKQSVKAALSQNLLPPKGTGLLKLDFAESLDPSSGSSIPACGIMFLTRPTWKR